MVLDAYYYEAGPSLAPTIQFKSWMVSPDGDSPEWRREHLRLGFGHMSYTRYRIHYYALFLPHWFVAFVLLAPPYFWWRRRRWVSNDVMACKTCSYNLTGNTSGVCPECGASLEQDASIRSVG